MQITFNTPYGFSADSTPTENAIASRILRDTVSRLNGAGSGASVTIRRTGRTYFTFNLPTLFCIGSTPVQDGAALSALMDGLIALNAAYLSTRYVPPLYVSDVTYGRTDIWDTIPALYYGRKPPPLVSPYGDCKSLSAALVAEYRKQGIDCSPSFRWIRTPLGTVDYHILVLTAKGFEDPSKVKGMGTNEVAPGDLTY
jgi:hypothetical protein